MKCTCSTKGKELQTRCAECEELCWKMDAFQGKFVVIALSNLVNKVSAETWYLLNETWLDGCRAFLWNGSTFSDADFELFIASIRLAEEQHG